MLSINGKKFLNLPEAVQWLLNNNALPFQCKVNYVADTIIAKTDIINPSPAEIKVGSLVLFADSKVGTVSGLTDSGFMVGQDYTDIGAQLNQIVSIDLDASQHLVFTLANGDTIDAGLVKELSGLSIDASQHLIATFNDGSTIDLGAIFQGNINISGTLTASHARILEQIEDANGHLRFIEGAGVPMVSAGFTSNYCRWSLSGTHLMFVLAGTFEENAEAPGGNYTFARFTVPAWVYDKIYPVFASSHIESKETKLQADDWSIQTGKPILVLGKSGENTMSLTNVAASFNTTKLCHFRVQFDLLIDNN